MTENKINHCERNESNDARIEQQRSNTVWITGLIIYLILLLLIIFVLLTTNQLAYLLSINSEKNIILLCSLVGMVAGILYCLRGIYVNTGTGRWNDKWFYWYILRPITSGISGFASCIFLKAGLLTLGASTISESVPFGYLALAFISGYNVDSFMKKIEQIAGELWGIDKSRSARKSDADLTQSVEHQQEHKHG